LTLVNFLTPLLNLVHFNYTNVPLSPLKQPSLQFELRQYHAITPNAQVLFHDVSGSVSQDEAQSISPIPSYQYDIRTRRLTTHRPSLSFADPDFVKVWRKSRRRGEVVAMSWDEEEVDAPNVESRETLLELAKMANNAYLLPNETEWYDLDGKWNISYPFGWEPDQNGFRGHVFATPDNSTVVLAIKGTSASYLGGGSPTSKKDKFNDNLRFSCCCARVDWTCTTVCGCYRGGWKCDQSCLEEALVEDSLFYPLGTNLYNNITYMYPDSTIWVIGHSLGGALASMLGATFGAPSVAFESPGEKMAASRLHLPSPPSVLEHVTHVYHTADPIAMGTCNGGWSSCALGGYAMESKCHLGKSIVYDTVSNFSWTVDIRTHTITNVIERILNVTWPPSVEIGREVPEATPEDDCVECYSWEFGDYPL